MTLLLLLLLIATAPWTISAEKPIVPEPQESDIPASFNIQQYPEGIELLRKTTHFTQTSLYFLKLITDEKQRTEESAQWVNVCKKAYSLMNTLHHQSNFWLTQASSLPAKGITLSRHIWDELAHLATIVQTQEDFLASVSKKKYLALIAHTESEVLKTHSESFIQSRIRTYINPSRWQRENVTQTHIHR
jgi:hypothetical protein